MRGRPPRPVRRTGCLDSPTVGKKAARYLSATLLAALLIGSLAGCGTDRSNLLSSETAAGLEAEIDRIETLVANGDCFAAVDRAGAVQDQVEGLEDEIDERLRTTLLDGLTQLVLVIQDECGTEDVVETITEEETPSEETGGTRPQPDGGDERPRPEPEPEPEPEPTPTPTPTPVPPDSGGVSPGGVTPTPGGGSG